jgi:exodeoxyribonuclease VII large subunit
MRDLLAEAFSSVWVVGEVQRLRPSQRGHVYFELVEKGERDEIVGKLDAVIWKTEYQKIERLIAATGQRLTEGVEIRCRGGMDFYPPGGRLQLVVREIDPTFTLGLLEARRRETLAALAAAGLLERNRGLPLVDLPLRIGLITSQGSAAYHDFFSGLRDSGYGFQVVFVHAAVQGRDAEREVVSALSVLAALGAESGLPLDAVILIRGGGSRTDLAAFDSRAIAEAVAMAPFPVLTGLGHEIDQSISDLAAHTAFKTPTKVAEFLIEQIAAAERRLAELRQALRREALEPLRAGRESLELAERGVRLAGMRLEAAGARLAEHARALARFGRSALRLAERRQGEMRGRLGALAPRRLVLAERDRVHRGERIAAVARGSVREAAARLSGLERLCRQLGPDRTLERGFSLTRDAAGILIRRPEQVRAGDLLATQLAGGAIHSRVEEP